MNGTTWYGEGTSSRWPVSDAPPGSSESGAPGAWDARRGAARQPAIGSWWGGPWWSRPDRRAGVLLLVVAVAFDVAVHGRVDGVASAAFVAVVAGALLASGRLRSTGAAGVALAAVPFGVAVAWRTSLWLVPIDAVASVGLLLVGASYGAGGRLSALSPADVVVRLARGVLSLVVAPAFLLGALVALAPVHGEQRKARLVALARGTGLAVPIVLVLGLLLAAADPVFASIFHVPFDAGAVVGHSFFVAVGLVLGAALFVEASSEPLGELVVGARPLGATECGVVLGGLVALYAAFSATQVVAAKGGARTVLETAGLTYADYARQGFFQLLGVAGLTLVVLLGLRTLGRPATGAARAVLIVLGEVAIALTLVIVGVAIHRLGLYEDAFGLTMLRLTCTAVAWWLGAVFVLVAVASAGVGRGRRWVGAALVVSALVALLAFNVMDPESIVVERNVDHALATGRFDGAYLAELSDDAVPALVSSLDRLGPNDRAQVLVRVCGAAGRSGPIAARTALERNHSATRAAAARAAVCG